MFRYKDEAWTYIPVEKKLCNFISEHINCAMYRIGINKKNVNYMLTHSHIYLYLMYTKTIRKNINKKMIANIIGCINL